MLFWLKQNWSSIVLAFFLSLVVWTIAVQEENPIEEDILNEPVPVTVIGPDAGLVVTNDFPREAMATLRAPRNTWRALSAEDVLVTTDLTGLGPGTHQVPLSVEIAGQATLVLINPAQIRVILEEEGQRDIPVQLVLAGQPATGYRVDQATVEPDSVIVRGPLSLVDRVSELRVEVSVGDLRGSYEADLPALALDSEGQRIETINLTPPQVHVTVPVRQEAGYKEVSVIARTEGQPAQGYFVTSITTSPLTVTIRGTPAAIARMPGYVETTPIDLTDLRDDLIQNVPLVLPVGVTPVEHDTVEVQITIAAQRGSRTERHLVEAQGLPEGFSAEFSPPEVDVILSGPLPVLDTLADKDVRVLVDLGDYEPGSYQVELNVVVLRDQVVIESVVPQVVEVEIVDTTRPTSRGS